ncbi:MAG: DUF4349 domain-containing protein [Chloroflexi bacterium]|nr:DUF4349 domain-containing protein [Chloroflexota bacterium]MQC19126.1 DUF4349 domain-containing protein [Chloroflexota bacterium]
MQSITTALRAMNQRLLVIAAILLFFGFAWVAWVNLGGSGDDSASVTQGGTSSNTGFPGGADGMSVARMPAPGAESPPMANEERGSFDAVSGESGVKIDPDSGGDVLLQSTIGRTVIRNGQMELAVESVTDSFERVRQMTEAAGGFVADSTIYGRGDHQSASLTLRVPADRFGQVMADLRLLGIDVNSLSTSSQDVTEEYADLEATLRNLTAVESQYLELLGRTETIGDVLMVQDRLNQVRLQIERVQGRINLLDHLTSLATISVYLTHDSIATIQEPSDGLLDAAREAWDASLAALTSIARAVIVVAVFSWWLVPVLMVALVLGRRVLRTRTRVDTPEGQA